MVVWDVKSRAHDRVIVLSFLGAFIFFLVQEIALGFVLLALGLFCIRFQEKALKPESEKDKTIYVGVGPRSLSLFLDSAVHFALLALLLLMFGTAFYDFGNYAMGSFVFFFFSVFLLKRWSQSIGKMLLGLKVVKTDLSRIGWKEIFLRESADVIYVFWLSAKALLVMAGIMTVNLVFVNTDMRCFFPASLSDFLMRKLLPLYSIWLCSEMIVLLTNRRKRALHDYLAGTVVVFDQKANWKWTTFWAILITCGGVMGFWLSSDRYSKTVYDAEKGVAESQQLLGYEYYRGHFGKKQDYALALVWFRRSAAQNNSRAQYFIGKMYESGMGVPMDEVEAEKWFKLSADNGDGMAENELKDLNDPYHYYSLGFAFYQGRFEIKDYAKALYWFQKAADKGEKHAFGYLGEMYEKGLGVPVDMDKALKLYIDGSGKGDYKSKNALRCLGK